MRNPDEELPYRSAVPISTGPAKDSIEDEQHHSTLLVVFKMLDEAVEGLYKEFNAFTIRGGDGHLISPQQILTEIDGNQKAYDIVAPLRDTVRDAIAKVDNRYKE